MAAEWKHCTDNTEKKRSSRIIKQGVKKWQNRSSVNVVYVAMCDFFMAVCDVSHLRWTVDECFHGKMVLTSIVLLATSFSIMNRCRYYVGFSDIDTLFPTELYGWRHRFSRILLYADQKPCDYWAGEWNAFLWYSYTALMAIDRKVEAVYPLLKHKISNLCNTSHISNENRTINTANESNRLGYKLITTKLIGHNIW